MENQTPRPPTPVEPVLQAPAQIALEYRTAKHGGLRPRDDGPGPNVADVLAGAVAIAVTTATGLLALATLFTAIGAFREDGFANRFIGAASIATIGLVAILVEIRTAWFYLGGWNRGPNRRANMRTLFPWNWR